MFRLPSFSARARTPLLLLLLAGLAVSPAFAKKKKPAPAPAAAPAGPRKFPFDPKKLVWPSPPSVARIHWLDYFTGVKIDYAQQTAAKPKASWMDRLAGAQAQEEKINAKTFPFQMIGPYGLAVNSKGLIYVADQRVGAVFIFDPKNHDNVQMIRNGFEAHFGLINCIAIDDDDRIFISDGKLHRVLVFSPKHELLEQISDGIQDPVGLAIDTTNRFLYVVDTQQDQVLIYDADSFKLLRRIGTGGKNHFLTTPGDFGAPQGAAVDADGNLYVTDTMNDRVEIFDAEGSFVSTFGKAGDGPGYFARPKGIAVDSDGHIWVADQMQDRLQVFNKEGQLLTYIGQGHGELPGQFQSLVGVAIDKNNNIYTTEQEPGRTQMFHYVTDAEAAAEKQKKQEDLDKAAEHRQKAAAPADSAPATAPAAAPPVATPDPAKPATPQQ